MMDRYFFTVKLSLLAQLWPRFVFFFIAQITSGKMVVKVQQGSAI